MSKTKYITTLSEETRKQLNLQRRQKPEDLRIKDLKFELKLFRLKVSGQKYLLVRRVHRLRKFESLTSDFRTKYSSGIYKKEKERYNNKLQEEARMLQRQLLKPLE